MAARLGVQDVVYCRWERGESLPSLEARPAVHRELGAWADPDAGHCLGERLRAWRTTPGLSQAAVGRMAGMDAKTLGKIERSAYVSTASKAAVEALLASEMQGRGWQGASDERVEKPTGRALGEKG